VYDRVQCCDLASAIEAARRLSTDRGALKLTAIAAAKDSLRMMTSWLKLIWVYEYVGSAEKVAGENT
jgi:hypothetical protein